MSVRQTVIDNTTGSRVARGVRRRLRIWSCCVLSIVGCLVVETLWPGLAVAPTLTSSIGPATLLMVFLAALFCEYIDSTLGMGYGTTLTQVAQFGKNGSDF